MSFLDRALGTLGLRPPPLAVGDLAPDFTLTDSEGKAVSLGDLVAAGPALLAFYPRAFTGGCTKEMRGYRDRHTDLVDRGARLAAISVDDPATLARFKESLQAPYTFLSDPGGKVSERYAGVSLGTANRVTVTVGSDRRVKRITSGLAAIFPGGDIEACPLAKPAAPIS